MIPPHTFDLMKKIGNIEFVDPILLGAVALKETNCHPWKVRYEPAWRYYCQPHIFAKDLIISLETEKVMQATSWGLCQVMGSVARELGFKEDLPKLCLEEINITYAAKKLKTLLRRYNALDDVIAAYNAGIPRVMSNKQYFNQSYVNGVKANMKDLKKA